MAPVQADADAALELACSAGPQDAWAPNHWYLVDRVGLAYEVVWSSPEMDEITYLGAIEYDGDPATEVLVVSGSKFSIYDAKTRGLQASFNVSVPGLTNVRFADPDQNGTKEFWSVYQNGLFMSRSDGSIQFVFPGYTGSDLQIGNVDNNSGLEFVITGAGGSGLVLNGPDRFVKWSYAPGFGRQIELANVDADPAMEIVGAETWNRISVYDAQSRTTLYNIATALDIGALHIADVEGDGPTEIIYGDNQWGSIHVCNGATGAVKWSTPNPEHGTTDLAFGDFDGDSSPELAVGAGYTSSGPDRLLFVDTVSHGVEWSSTDINGPFPAMAVGDFDGDGDRDLAYGSFQSDSGYAGGTIFVRDIETRQLLGTRAPDGIDFCNLWRIRAANIDADPQDEIFFTGSRFYNGQIICLDGASLEEQFRTVEIEGASYRGLEIVDVDNDGQLEVVASVYREHTGASGTYAYVYNAQTGALEWRSPQTGVNYFASLEMLRVGNVDADGNMEIVVGESNGAVYIYDGVTHALELQTPDIEVVSLELANLDASPRLEIVVGTYDGTVAVRSPSTGAVTQTLLNAGEPVYAIRFGDLTSVSGQEFVYAALGRLHVRSLRRGGASRWSSELFGSGVAGLDGLLITDADSDGDNDLLANVGNLGIRLFEFKPNRILR